MGSALTMLAHKNKVWFLTPEQPKCQWNTFTLPIKEDCDWGLKQPQQTNLMKSASVVRFEPIKLFWLKTKVSS